MVELKWNIQFNFNWNWTGIFNSISIPVNSISQFQFQFQFHGLQFQFQFQLELELKSIPIPFPEFTPALVRTFIGILRILAPMLWKCNFKYHSINLLEKYIKQTMEICTTQ